MKLKIKTSIHGCSEDVDDAGGDARFEEEEEEAEPKRMPESSEVGREIEIALLVDFSSSYFSVEWRSDNHLKLRKELKQLWYRFYMNKLSMFLDDEKKKDPVTAVEELFEGW